MIKRCSFLTVLLFTCFTLTGYAQHRTKHRSPRHTRHKRENKTLVNDSTSDDAGFSLEFSLGNENPWSGELYNEYPAAELTLSYNNGKKVEFGIFGCFTTSSLNDLGEDGTDIYFAYAFTKKLSLNLDAYTFLAKQQFLEDEFGFHSSIYNSYTARLQYDASPRHSFNLGYTAYNNTSEIQQSVTIDYTYNLSKNFLVTIGYGTDNNVLKGSIRNIYSQIGYETTVGNDKLPVKFSTNINPLFVAQEATDFPIAFTLSVEF